MGRRTRGARSLIAGVALAVTAAVTGCGPVLSGPVPDTAPTTPAVTATTLSVRAADTSIAFGSGVEVTFVLDAAGGTLPPAAGAAVSVGRGVVTQRAPVDAAGRASIRLDAATLMPGANVVTVAYPGDARYAAASGTTTVRVAPAASTVAVTLTPTDTGTTGAVASVVTATGVPAAGTVAFAVDNTPVGTAPVTDGAAAADIPAGLAIGEHTVDATFTPDAAEQISAGSGTALLMISKTLTTVVATGRAGSLRYGDHTGFTVAVTPQGPPADLTGAVTVSAGGSRVAEGSTDASGAASLDFYNTADPGTKTYTVSYAGNDRVEPAAAEFAVRPRPGPTSISGSPSRP